ALIIDATKLYAGAAAIVVAALLFAFFRFAPLGKAIRACADNYVGALVVGLDVKRLYALTFGIGAACVGAAGVMMTLIVDVTPMIGPTYTLLAFVIVITGGGFDGGCTARRAVDWRDRGLGWTAVHAIGKEHVRLRHTRCGSAVPATRHSRQKIDRMSATTPSSIAAYCTRVAASLVEDVSRPAVIVLGIFLAALVIASFLVNDYLLTVLIVVLYFAFTGQAWNIMMGFAGQLSLGHAIYAGLGAYIAAVLFKQFAIAPWIGFFAGLP